MKKIGRKNKIAQVTMFVIMAIIIVAIIALFLYLRHNQTPDEGGKKDVNPITVFESCLEDQLQETVKIMLKQGGYLNNSLNISFRFNDSGEIQDISYLCYTSKEFIPCTNQEPLLMDNLEEEIKKGVSTQVRICFDDMASTMASGGEAVDANYQGFNVTIAPKQIIVYLNGNITSTKSGKTISQSQMSAAFPSRLYEITRVVQEIINMEAGYCYFGLSNFMISYPEFEIDKAMTRNYTTIYSVEHTKGVERFDFAVRSCSLPAGFG